MSEAGAAVIGGGYAGVAAAWRLARADVPVTLLSARPGASALSSGAIDLPEASDLEALRDVELLELVAALGSLTLEPCTIATPAGQVRAVAGRDSQLLDLEACRGLGVAVADIPRDDWNARQLSAQLNATAWAARTATRFVAVLVDGLQHGHERRVAAFDFAKLHDEPARSAWLAQRCREASPGAAAWLFGPWLGVESPAAARLCQALGAPVGEVSSGPGGPAGARFEIARQRLLAESEIAVVDADVVLVAATAPGAPGRYEVTSTRGRHFADAVVIAVGGAVGGGVRLAKLEHQLSSAGFQLSLELPFEPRFALNGEPLRSVGSQHGFDFAAHGLSALTRVGLIAQAGRLVEAPGLFAAGDVLADRRRGVLEAMSSGLGAARALIRDRRPRVV